MTQAEKQTVIDSEIDKILSDLPDYRRPQPSDKYSLEPITEDEQGKFIHGQKWPIKPTEPTKLKSASRRPIKSTIKPIKPKELKSLLFEVTVMEYSKGHFACTKLLSADDGYVILNIPDSTFRLKIPVTRLRKFLYDSISEPSQGQMTFEKGKHKFKVAIEINPQLLIDSDEATLI